MVEIYRGFELVASFRLPEGKGLVAFQRLAEKGYERTS
jgi:hypothetical protein